MLRALVCILVVVFACLPARAEGEEGGPEAVARRFLERLAQADFEAARQDYDEGMRQALPPGRMEAIWKGLVQDAGPYEGVEPAKTTETQGYTVVDVPTVFARKILVLRVALDGEGRIAGFFRVGERPRRDEPGQIALDTGAGVLRGTLELPDGEAPFPLAVLIAGSGPTDRDGNQPPAMRPDTLRLLAHDLKSARVATLRYDKRGVGQSAEAGPDESKLTVDRFAEDVALWVRKVRADPRFDRIVLVGHSEGALLATLAAQQEKVGALVLLAGPGRKLGALLREQLAPKLTPDLRAESERILAALEAGHEVADVPPALAVLYRPSVQPFLRSILALDPAAELAKVHVPTLVVQGTTDVQVSVADAARLAAAREGIEKVVVDGMNHVLKRAATPAEQAASYASPDLPLDAALLPAVDAFLRRVLLERTPASATPDVR